MALPDLATTADLTEYGYDATTAGDFLARASVRVRRYTRQDITAGTSTVRLQSWPYRLPQRPVTAVTSVVTPTGTPLTYTLGTAGMLDVHGCHGGPVDVTYEHGFDELPDELVELVCSIASRMASTPSAVGSGAQTEQAGGESVTWGSDAYGGTTALTRAERKELDRIFPKLPSTTFLRP